MRRFLALSAVLVAASCSSGDATTTAVPTTEQAATTISTTAQPATTTTRPTTTTSAGTALPEVPLPDVKIDDAREAYRLIVGFIDDLSRNPQPDLLELYYDPAPDCNIYPLVVEDFQLMADNQWHYAVLEPTEITRLLPVFRDETDAIVLSTYRIAPDEVYDAQGNLVREDPEQLFEKSISLTNRDGFGWRICNAEDVVGQ